MSSHRLRTGEVRETAVEKHLARIVLERGGVAAKHVSPGRAGDPDRLVAIPRPACPTCGCAVDAGLVELKRPGQQPRPLQDLRMQEWASVGLRVGWADTPEKVDALIRSWTR